jgi:hypothetical protein
MLLLDSIVCSVIASGFVRIVRCLTPDWFESRTGFSLSGFLPCSQPMFPLTMEILTAYTPYHSESAGFPVTKVLLRKLVLAR